MADEVTPDGNAVPDDVVEAAVAEEKKNYSLSDRIKNIRRKTAKVLVFLDMTAVDDYDNQNAVVQLLAKSAESTTDENGDELTGKALTEAKKRRLETFTAAEEKLFELRDIMLENALSFHMQAIPNVAVDKCLRMARTDFPTLGSEPDDSDASKQQDENRQDRYMTYLVHAATAVVGQVTGKPTKPSLEEVLALHDELEPSQWTRIVATMQSLVFLDSVRQKATDDPGF